MNKFKIVLRAMVAFVVLAVIASSSYAVTTNDVTVGGTEFASGLKTPVVVVGTVDFADYTGVAADVYKVIYIPAESTISAVWTEVLSTNNSTMSYYVGDIGTTNAYLGPVSANTIASTLVTGKTNSYDSATYLTVVIGGTADIGKVRVKALITKF